MSWSIAVVLMGCSLPFFFLLIGNLFSLNNKIFVFLKLACFCVALLSLNMVTSLASLVVETVDSSAVGTINALASISRGLWYIGFVFCVFIVYWYLQGVLFSVVRDVFKLK